MGHQRGRSRVGSDQPFSLRTQAPDPSILPAATNPPNTASARRKLLLFSGTFNHVQPPDRDHDLRPQDLELAQQVRPAVREHGSGGYLVPAAPRLPREAPGQGGEVDLSTRDARLREPSL